MIFGGVNIQYLTLPAHHQACLVHTVTFNFKDPFIFHTPAIEGQDFCFFLHTSCFFMPPSCFQMASSHFLVTKNFDDSNLCWMSGAHTWWTLVLGYNGKLAKSIKKLAQAACSTIFWNLCSIKLEKFSLLVPLLDWVWFEGHFDFIINLLKKVFFGCIIIFGTFIKL